MDLNINSPSYYTQEHGVEDDIYWMCRDLSAYVKEKKYSDAINIIGIVPIIAPASVLEKGLCKAHKKCVYVFFQCTFLKKRRKLAGSPDKMFIFRIRGDNNSAWIKIIVKRFGFTEKFRTENDV